MKFYFPWIFLGLLIVPYLWKTKTTYKALSFSGVRIFQNMKVSFLARYQKFFLKLIRTFCFVLFLFALARPRTELQNVWEESDAVDILLIVDVSTSMLAEDFTLNGKRLNRLEVVKNVISDFVKTREKDRLGIVMFAGEPMIVCPLTTDYSVLNEFLEMVRVDVLEDGTAIGDALGFGVNRLRHSQAKSKVMILLTDGSNNAGQIDPMLGAEVAEKFGIKVYTIGAGKKGEVPYPVEHPLLGRQYRFVEIPIDETVLKKVAQKTGGKYFRATSSDGLREIYGAINEMEKTKIKTSRSVEYREVFHWFLIPAVILLCLEIGLTNTLFLRIP